MKHASYSMLIDGQLVGAAAKQKRTIINPASEEVIAEVPEAGAEDVDAAVHAADRAFTGFSATTPQDRSLMLWRLAEVVDNNAEELALLECCNVGKPISLARSEIPFIVDNLRFFAGAARHLEGQATGEYAAHLTSWIRREALGVVASIAPWNYPLMMAAWKIAPALAAGNTVVLKPAEQTPLSTLRLCELAKDIFPRGVFNVVTGDGDPVGTRLVDHPKVAMVSLTGEVSTGKAVARAAANTLKRVHLELGGKAPMLVFEDANVEHVVKKIRSAAFVNTGQDCTAACRVYVSAKLYDQVLAKLVPAVQSLVVGDVQQEKTEMGPLISREQQERVAQFVERALKAKSGKILTGGKVLSGAGFYYAPTIIADAQQDAEIIQREIFGPVVTVSRFEDDAAVLHMANDVDYGLAASVWTNNLQRALEFSRKLRFGTVWINDHLPLVSEMPHGGFKDSGYGKDMSRYALDHYCEIKHVMARLGT